MLGLVIDENQPDYERGDFLVRPVIGADPDGGSIVIGERVRVGQTVRMHVRDGASADEDLREALRMQAAALGEAGAAGALLFTCNGRGDAHVLGARPRRQPRSPTRSARRSAASSAPASSGRSAAATSSTGSPRRWQCSRQADGAAATDTVRDLVARALAEDLGSGDVTAEAVVPAEAEARARIVQKEPGVVFGLEVAGEVFAPGRGEVVRRSSPTRASGASAPRPRWR